MLQKISVVMLVLALVACSAPERSEPNAGTEAISDTVRCPEERAQICTRDYRPVCATRDTGVRCITAPCPSSEQHTYANACSACADQKVIKYRPGTCPQESTKE